MFNLLFVTLYYKLKRILFLKIFFFQNNPECISPVICLSKISSIIIPGCFQIFDLFFIKQNTPPDIRSFHKERTGTIQNQFIFFIIYYINADSRQYTIRHLPTIDLNSQRILLSFSLLFRIYQKILFLQFFIL